MKVIGALTYFLLASTAALGQDAPDGRTYLREMNETRKLLNTFVIPKVDFDDTPLNEALDFIGDAVRKKQPDFHVNLADGFDDVKITLRLSNVPATEALRYTTDLAEAGFHFVEGGVEVVAPDAKLKPVTLSYKMDDDWFKLAKEYLTTNVGVVLPVESAAYDEKTGRMTVKADYDGHISFDKYLENWRDQLPKMIRITVDVISMKARPAQKLLARSREISDDAWLHKMLRTAVEAGGARQMAGERFMSRIVKNAKFDGANNEDEIKTTLEISPGPDNNYQLSVIVDFGDNKQIESRSHIFAANSRPVLISSSILGGSEETIFLFFSASTSP